MAGDSDNFSDYYINYSRNINYEVEDSSEKKAGKVRRLSALKFFSAVRRSASDETVSAVLAEGFETYRKLVDDPKGINNYANRVLELLPNNLAGNQCNWKTSLSVDKIRSFLEPLPCSNGESDPWLKLRCSNSHPTSSDIQAFYAARMNFTPFDKPQAPAIDNLKSFKVGTDRGQVDAPQEHRSMCPPKFTLPRKPENEQPHNAWDGNRRRVEEKKGSVSAFKTANEELKVQNMKRYGKEGGKCDGQYGYGVVKKSLGARKGGGVHGKFQPPILKNESDENQEVKKTYHGEESETEMDERLKNIDPKMIETIRNEIMDVGPKLTWDDIAGLEFAKSTIQEIVVWPMLRPDIFTGLRRPPKGILLFGPPGTGKTLIGKCIASQSGATFLSISASSLTSKWVGDGEKMVRALFAVARVYQPSVVFIDEIDSLLSQRSDSEHESSRRIKTEFLVQLDGVGSGEEDRILIIGATNRPQELDEAARRRLVKRLYIPLPDLNARFQMVQNLIANERHTLTDNEINEIAALTDGYSGADVKHVCQEASLGPIRSIPVTQICAINTSQVRPLDISDFRSALTRVKSTVSADDLHSYLAWDKQFGCGAL